MLNSAHSRTRQCVTLRRTSTQITLSSLTRRGQQQCT